MIGTAAPPGKGIASQEKEEKQMESGGLRSFFSLMGKMCFGFAYFMWLMAKKNS